MDTDCPRLKLILLCVNTTIPKIRNNVFVIFNDAKFLPCIVDL